MIKSDENLLVKFSKNILDDEKKIFQSRLNVKNIRINIYELKRTVINRI